MSFADVQAHFFWFCPQKTWETYFLSLCSSLNIFEDYIIMSLLSFLSAEQLKPQPQSFAGCLFQRSDYSCCFLLNCLPWPTLSLMYSTPHDTLLQLRLSQGYLVPGDYFTSLPDNTPSKMFPCFSGNGMTSVLQTWPRCGGHIYTSCRAHSCFILAIGNATLSFTLNCFYYLKHGEEGQG